MKYQLSGKFRKKYKKQNVRIKNAIEETLQKFSKNPQDSSLHNHPLERKLQGFRSINIGDIDNNYRAIYEVVTDDNDSFAYFEDFGTHEELFKD